MRRAFCLCGGLMTVLQRLTRWWRGTPVVASEPAAPPAPGRVRGVVDHVIILDGTLSSLEPGQESNAGLLFKLLQELPRPASPPRITNPGCSGRAGATPRAFCRAGGLAARSAGPMAGWPASIARGTASISSVYSRGAYAVRSLAGVIDRIGLLRREEATERAVRQVWRHYRQAPASPAARAFAAAHCHALAPIEVVGVWDTVKALGLRLPLLWMLTEKRTAFHSPYLGRSIRHGFHALALNETRAVFEPVMWQSPPDWTGNVEQVWFRGGHADVGGQVGHFPGWRGPSPISRWSGWSSGLRPWGCRCRPAGAGALSATLRRRWWARRAAGPRSFSCAARAWWVATRQNRSIPVPRGCGRSAGRRGR